MLRYSGLYAYDAMGRALGSSMDVGDGGISLKVKDQGAVYPITIDPFIEQKKLTVSDGAAGDEFGFSVAISGDTAIVGAFGDDHNVEGSGAAYIFQRDHGGTNNWGQVRELTASDGTTGAQFGRSVAISGDTAIVGAVLNGANGEGSGSAYIFQRDHGGTDNWGEVKRLFSSSVPTVAAGFGFSVAISGDRVIVGALSDSNFGLNTGSAYIFEWNQGGADNLGEVKRLLGSGTFHNEQFGNSVAISGDTAIVGHRSFVGSAHIFERTEGGENNWGEVKRVFASDGTNIDRFGESVAISGDRAIVGAFLKGGGVGAAYIFERNEPVAANWGEVQKLTASDGAGGDRFGISVAISGDTAIVGAHFDGDKGVNSGSAYVFGMAAIPPIADAGPDQTVNEGALVTLDGSRSRDPDFGPLSYAWTQVAGPGVSLDLTDPVHPTFLAPAVPAGGAVLTFELRVDDGEAMSAPDTVDVVVKNVNQRPVADAGDDQAVREDSPVTLDATRSFDPDGEVLSYSWVQTGGPAVTLSDASAARPSFTAPLVGPLGTLLTFALTVSDGMDSAVATVNVAVDNVNHPPVADAGVDQTRDEGSLVTLDGFASGDPDGDGLTYAWTQVGGPAVTLSDASAAQPTFTAPQVGSGGAALGFRLVVDDGLAASEADEVVITLRDLNDPPSCALARANPELLWPPNHKLVRVGIQGVTDPNDNGMAITITGVTQDEPVNGLGDGDTSPDAVLQGDSVLIRAERSGRGNGRVYRIAFTADDGQGGSCAGAVTVVVPHSMKPGSTPIDDGQLYDSTRP